MQPVKFEGAVKVVNVKALASADVGARVVIETNQYGGLEALVGCAVSVVITVLEDKSPFGES